MLDCDWAGTLPALWRAVKQAGVPFSEVRYLLCSHYHPDHAGLAQELKGRGLTLIVLDTQLEHLHTQDPIFAKEGNLDFQPIREEGNRVITAAESRAFLASLGLAGEILSTPGHSPDGISLLLDAGYAFTGDLAPLETVRGFADPLLEDSWNRILAFGAHTALGGHWPPRDIRGLRSLADLPE